MLNIENVSQKIQSHVRSYIEQSGQAQIGIFNFPEAAAMPDWTSFLSVLNTTLIRLAQHPVYVWIQNGTDRLLILCINGYFRSSLTDVCTIMQRLWERRNQTVTPLLLASLHCDPLSVDSVLGRIFQTLGAIEFHYYPMYHQRSYGYSKDF